MAELDLQNIIRAVTAEVFKRLGIEPTQKDRTLAVLPGYVFDRPGVLRYLKEKEKDVDLALFPMADALGAEYPVLPAGTAEEQKRLVARLKDYNSIVIVTPPLSVLRALVAGDDADFVTMLCLRPLLWGYRVTVLLDFEAPRFHRSTALAQIADCISALEQMGVSIVALPQKKAVYTEVKSLVTEQDVKDAAREERSVIRVTANAIVTQLAEDTAKELEISIEYERI